MVIVLTIVVLALLALATRARLRSDTDSVSNLEFLDVGPLQSLKCPFSFCLQSRIAALIPTT